MASVGPDFIRQGLLSRGLPAHIAEGFVMNIADESGFNPAINEISPTVSGSRGGFGLYQLTGPRRVAFERFAADRGVSASDPNAQLDFLMTELQGPEARAARSIFSAQDAPTAAAAIARDFLRPAPENLQRRVARYTGITPEQSVARDTRQALGFDAPTGATQMEQQQQPGGIRGLLSNPDFLDSLAIGFGGLTQNPNQALMQMSADRIAGRAQTRQDTQSKNKTIEFLRAQPGGERFVQLVDAIGAVAALKAYQDSQEPAPDRGQILSAVQMREMFPGTQIEDGLYNLKPDGTANKVGGGGTTVNMPGEQMKIMTDGRIAVADPSVEGGVRFVTAPGSPAAQETQAAQVDMQAQAATAQDSLELINSVLNSPSLESVTGMIQGRLPAMSQSGTDLVTRIEQLQGQAFLQAFESLKGGGSITEVEGQAATNAIARLNRAQSAEAFRESLRDLQEIYQRAVDRVSNGGSAAPTTTGNTINGVTVGEPY